MQTDWSVMKKPDRQGSFLFGRKKGDNAWKGLIELSFAMDFSPDRALFMWSGPAYSNFGTKNERDGHAEAQSDFELYSKKYPDWEFRVVDYLAEDCPFEFDWDEWHRAKEPSDTTLSGVKNKFRARNVRFREKGESL